MLNTKLKYLKNVIYKLKRSYGLPAVLHKIDEHSVDPITGDKTTVIGTIKVNKFIVLRAREHRSFVYDLAYISANKDFSTGAFFDPSDRQALVDAKDLQGYEPKVGDYWVFENKHYTITQLYHFEKNYIYGFLLRAIDGANVVSGDALHSGLLVSHQVTSSIRERLDRQISHELNLTQKLVENA